MSPFRKFPCLFCICLLVLIRESTFTQSHLSKRQLKNAFKEFVRDSVFKHAQLSFQLTDFKTNKTILEFNEQKNLIPASILKLVPAVLLLDAAGPGFCFKTPVYLAGKSDSAGYFNGHIVISGRGDPSLCSPYMKEAIQLDSISDLIYSLLAAKGIHTIRGSIVVEQNYIKDLPENPEWLYYDLGNYYGGGCRSFNFNENEIMIRLGAASHEGGICNIIHETPDIGKQFFYSQVTGKRGPLNTEIFVLGSSLSAQKIIKGQWKCCSNDSISIRAAMHDPAHYFSTLLTNSLQEKGIRILDMVPVESPLALLQDSDSEILCEWISPPLHVLAQRALYKSVNLYSESFLHELGRIWAQSTNRDSILKAIDDSLRTFIFNNPGFEMEDGSGLSPKNYISASNMVQFLSKYRYYRGQDAFWKLIPDIHNSGGLRKYLKPKQNVKTALHLKSGSMERVRSYAGYLVVDHEIVAGLCIIVNNYPGQSEILHQRIAGFFDKVMLTKFK